MYIPITFKKLLEIGKQKEEFSNFHSEPAKFSQKIHKEKVFMKIFTINLTKLHTNSYQNIRYSYHYGKKIPHSFQHDFNSDIPMFKVPYLDGINPSLQARATPEGNQGDPVFITQPCHPRHLLNTLSKSNHLGRGTPGIIRKSNKLSTQLQ